MRASVGWKWKAGDCLPQTGCSTCKSSLQEAISVRLHLPTTKFGGMWGLLLCRKDARSPAVCIRQRLTPAVMTVERDPRATTAQQCSKGLILLKKQTTYLSKALILHAYEIGTFCIDCTGTPVSSSRTRASDALRASVS